MPDIELIARMNDLIDRAHKVGHTHTKFLTPTQISDLTFSFGKRSDVNLIVDGGFEESERAVAIFVEPIWGIDTYRREDVLSALKITHRKQDSLGHRDVMGAILGLGLDRSVLGDISMGDMAQGEPIYLVCLSDVATFLLDNLHQAGRIGVEVTLVPLETLTTRGKKLQEHSDSVASLRLDVVIASIFHLSRNNAGNAIKQGLVQLAHQTCQDVSKQVSIGAIISVRGFGRAKLLDVGGTSKKGRLWITYGTYV